jgi:hypothetical protein
MNDCSDCFLCTSPVPIDQEDANFAYLSGFAHGMAKDTKNEQRVHFCDEHTKVLMELLEEYGLILEAKPVQREISADNCVQQFMHCVECLKERPSTVPPRERAKLEAVTAAQSPNF